MEVTGKVIKDFGVLSGQTAGGKSWKKREFLIETMEQYSKKILFQMMGDKCESAEIWVGLEVTVSFSIESREYKDRYFTSANAYKVERFVSQTDRYTQQNNYPPPVLPVQDDSDDLPF